MKDRLAPKYKVVADLHPMSVRVYVVEGLRQRDGKGLRKREATFRPHHVETETVMPRSKRKASTIAVRSKEKPKRMRTWRMNRGNWRKPNLSF